MIRIVKKPEERRREIVSAARKLFLEKEYEKTTMGDVMKELEIAKGTIYHYFNSKEELLEAVVQDIVNEYLVELQSRLEESKGNAIERMQALITASNVAEKQSELLEQMHQSGNIGMHTRQLAVAITKLAPLYAEVIKQGCEEGVFNVERPLETAEFLLAGIQFLTDVGCYAWTKEDLARRKAAIADLVETQLGAANGSFQILRNN